MSDAKALLGAFAAALLDPDAPPPPGLATWNGSDPAVRFGVYRNNVVVSLVEALADTFPVTRALVGKACFDWMARSFLVWDPPRSPVLTEYGDAFPAFVAVSQPTAELPYLPDLARLELARVRAYHAADAQSLSTGEIAGFLAEPEDLPLARLTLHPSLAVIESEYGVATLWAAHQGQGLIEAVDPWTPESALVLRDRDDAAVIPIPPATAAFLAALAAGAALGEAAAAACRRGPDMDLAQSLALLIRHGGIAAWHPSGGPET